MIRLHVLTERPPLGYLVDRGDGVERWLPRERLGDWMRAHGEDVEVHFPNGLRHVFHQARLGDLRVDYAELGILKAFIDDVTNSGAERAEAFDRARLLVECIEIAEATSTEEEST